MTVSQRWKDGGKGRDRFALGDYTVTDTLKTAYTSSFENLADWL